MNSVRESELDNAYEKLMSIMLNQLPIDGVEELVDPKVMGFGTTIDEEIHDFDEVIVLIKRQEEQAKEAGLEFNFDRNLIHKRISAKEDTALFVEHIRVTYKTEELFHQFMFRFSAVMEYSDLGWKLIHWHGSIPSDIENDTWHLNEWKAEKEKLEKLVASQTADLQLKNSELEIEASTHRVRALAMGMQKPDDIMQVLNVIKEEVEKFELENVGTWFWILNDDNTLTQWDISEIDMNGTLANVNITLDLDNSESSKRHIPKWDSTDYYTMPWKGKELQNLIDEVKELDPDSGKMFQEAVDTGRMETYWQACAPFSKGVLGLDYPFDPPEAVQPILTKMADAFGMAYQRFEDLQKAEQRAYESKVETSLERVRGMAAAMNHSDDLMQIAEEMFKELEILKINPLRYGLGMIDGEKKEAELWASTVNDGHYLDMLGTISLTWHPMLQKVYDAWDAQHEEVIYELKGKELSDYYQKIGLINPDIPKLKELQDPNTEVIQFVSFFPFKSGALYAFTEGCPNEEGRSILNRFAHVFEQAHIRYNDLQKAERQAHLIREERDRLEIALKELRATQDQLVQQEKLASLGQLTAGIAHEIKNPLNFVNNFSEVSVELIEELREELANTVQTQCIASPPNENANSNSSQQAITEILDDIEANLKKIHEHGSRADSIVKSMLEHSRGGDGTMEPTILNGLVKEFVNLSFHGMRAGKEPINVDIEFDLDDSIGEVPLIAEDFSRVIINLCNNAFDAMREKQNSEFRILNSEEYKPKLTVRTKSENDRITMEIEDNGSGIPEEIKDKILQPFFTTKKGTQGTGLGLSITNDIVKAHGGILAIESANETGTICSITLKMEY